MEIIDREISYILDEARRQVEGLSRGVLYLEKKLKKYSALKYQESKYQLMQGRRYSPQVMAKRKLEAEVEDNAESLEEVKTKKQEALEEWNKVVKKGREIRERELLDLYDLVIEGDNDKSRKARKKQVNKLQKAEYRKWSLRYLTNTVGKGPNTSLKLIKIQDSEGKTMDVKYERNKIEEALISQNIAHYKKVLKTPMH